LAVVGPHIYSTRDLFEDYKGDQECYGGGDKCVRTIAEVFTTLHGAANTLVAKGVDIDSQDSTGIQAALNAVNQADQVVLVLGIGNTQEHEGIDRTNIILPGLQESFAKSVLATGKPVVLVLINGGTLSIDNLIQLAPAIIEAFVPAMRTGEALYLTIFGRENRWGKLPVTVYPANYINQVDMYSFDMTKAPGRTYRYYTDKPLFPFGFGLSYTTFSYTCTGKTASGTTSISCVVTNNGTRDGDEILQVYHRAGDDVRKGANHPVPARSLVDFGRYHLTMGEKANANFEIPNTKLVLTNQLGDKILYAGSHYLDITNGVNPSVSVLVTITQNETVEQAPIVE